MTDKRVLDFPASNPVDSDVLHTVKSSGEDNRTTVGAVRQHVLNSIPPPMDYHEYSTKAPATNDILKYENSNQLEYHKMTLGEMRRFVLQLVYPVGGLYFNHDSDTHPFLTLGFGSWVKLQGVHIVAAGTSTDAGGNVRTFTAGTNSGRHAVNLQPNEMAAHNHAMFANATVFGSGAPDLSGRTQRVAREWEDSGNNDQYRMKAAGDHLSVTIGTTGTEGTGAAHENTPFNIAVHIWRRVA